MNAHTAKLIRRFALRYEKIVSGNREAMLKRWWNQLPSAKRAPARRMLAESLAPTITAHESLVRAALRVVQAMRPNNPEPRVARMHGLAERRRAAKAHGRLERERVAACAAPPAVAAEIATSLVGETP